MHLATAALRTAAALLAATLLLPSALAQQSHPGTPGSSGGGTYRGPGDTVPSGGDSAGPSGPATPPPTGGGIGGAGSGGATPPPVAPTGPPAGTPPGGVVPGLPPDEPATPTAQPPADDPTSWQIWWHHNRWAYLPRSEAASAADASAESFFLGRGQMPQTSRAPRATPEDVATLVQPALLAALDEGGRRELVVYALQALAGLREHASPEGFGFDAAARRYLRDPNQGVAEGALLALGVRGDRAWTDELVLVLHDAEEGRMLVGRSKVGHRLRAYAAYGLALLAERTSDPLWRIEIHRTLAAALVDERPEVQAALLAALGNVAMPPEEARADGTHATGPVTLAGQIELVAAFLDDGAHSVLARSQAPRALAALAREAPEPLRARAAGALLAHVGPHAKAPTEVRNGVVIALGAIGRAGATEVDVEVRRALERVVVGPGADRLTRSLALIALAQAASRPGPDPDELAGVEPTRRFLSRQLERERGMQRAWAALALGILESATLQRGAMPAPESAAALRAALDETRNGDVAGAVALALGMLRDGESVAALTEIVRASGSGVLRGYAGLALGMIGDRSATEAVREALAGSTGLPGSLQRLALGLSLLGDPHAGPNLAGMLLEASSPDLQAMLASALGWIRDPRPLPGLCERLRAHGDDLARAWIAVAVGRIAEHDATPWVASFSVGVNYDVALATLHDPSGGLGVLDYP